MKRLALCGIVIAVMFTAGTGSALYVRKVTRELSQKLEAARLCCIAGDTACVSELSERILEEWEEFCTRNIFLTDRERALEISNLLIRIRAMAAVGDDDIPQECLAAQSYLEIYRKNQIPRLENIF